MRDLDLIADKVHDIGLSLMDLSGEIKNISDWATGTEGRVSEVEHLVHKQEKFIMGLESLISDYTGN